MIYIHPELASEWQVIYLLIHWLFLKLNVGTDQLLAIEAPVEAAKIEESPELSQKLKLLWSLKHMQRNPMVKETEIVFSTLIFLRIQETLRAHVRHDRRLTLLVAHWF